MYIEGETLDDLMNELLEQLLKLPFENKPSKGLNSEIFGVLLKLNNPRARISKTETKGKPFSALGELFWYLSKDNRLEFIAYYIKKYDDFSDDGISIHGGYGPRLYNMHGKFNQIERIIDLLKENPSSRKAVIQLFDASDLEKKYKDIPCTCTLQFVIRKNKLNMFTTMRSNDAFWGLPHDIFCFTMLQEIIATSLNVDLGVYSHAVGSMHLYKDHEISAQNYLNEGFQSTNLQMPSMPKGNPWNNIAVIRKIEEKIRLNDEVNISDYNLDNYWSDIAYLLMTFSLFKNENNEGVKSIIKNINDPIYKSYIEEKLR